MQKKCWEFWVTHIVGETPPVSDASQGMAQYLALQEATNEMYTPATDRAIDLMEFWYKAKDKQTSAAEELDGIANELKEMVVEAGGWGLAFGDSRLHYKPNKNGQRRFSTKGLSRDCFTR
jgi:predicted phage-related endonuclease